jgi:membrane-bound lytic murein transglycosylase A
MSLRSLGGVHFLGCMALCATAMACGTAPAPAPRAPGQPPPGAGEAAPEAAPDVVSRSPGVAPGPPPTMGPPQTEPAPAPAAPASPPPEAVVTSVEIAPEDWPALDDDLTSDDLDDLSRAIDRQLAWFGQHGADRVWRLGDESFTAADIAASLRLFRRLWQAHRRDPAALRRALMERFRLFRVEADGSPDILFSGYYAPIYRGSRKREGRFRYPLYGKPRDLVSIRPGQFDEKFLRPGHALRTGRVFARHDRASGEIVPYYTRKEIDGDRVLAGRRLELAYLERYWDTMTLQIQGGGYVELADGRLLRLSFAAGNNRGYRAVGRILVEEGHIPREELSMQAIDAYFTAHPEDLERVCFMNDSYVFFSASGPHERLTPDLHPAGVLGFPLTPRRAIATDKRWFPGGGLAFIAGRQRRADGASTPFSGFVIDQDTGGAIRGGHIDFFLGIGDAAGEDAGRLRDRQGRLYFLVARPDHRDRPNE